MRPAPEPRAALAAAAASRPETPFLFFRDARGHFGWWSWRRALAFTRGEAAVDPAVVGEAAAGGWLASVVGLGAAEAGRAATLLEQLSAPPGREIWLTAGGLSRDVDRIAALAAIAGGWAVVLDAGSRIEPQTFAWARPTLLAGEAAELADLLAGFAALAPRRRTAAWRRRHLARLRAVLIGAEAGAGDALAARLLELGSTARRLSIAPARW
ncbi:MAG: hypothetical protein NDJ75_06045 [Thermoanaerobaculia bacterium]|nr:hypothetical protein [Thermoanaerobaculia bacterium]